MGRHLRRLENARCLAYERPSGYRIPSIISQFSSSAEGEVAILWYYSQGELASGPITTEEVRYMISAGTLRPTDQIWPKGFSRRMAVEAGTLARTLRQDPSASHLPEWVVDLADSESSASPEWLRDVRTWEDLDEVPLNK